jgi:hypothetical protein
MAKMLCSFLKLFSLTDTEILLDLYLFLGLVAI